MNKTAIPVIMRKQYDVFHSEDGIGYEPRKVSMFDIVHICDYHYKDLSNPENKNMANIKEKIRMPVFFHHNDYWIVDGYDLAQVITSMTLIHKRDWRKVISGKWRLQPDWLREWHNAQNDTNENK